ncbi:MAG: pseudouridine synthase [Burkholderiales bacterium]|nr:pseudouridine synthase [Burkholderiales bacterium]
MQDPKEQSPDLDASGPVTPDATSAAENAPKPKRARRTKAAEVEVIAEVAPEVVAEGEPVKRAPRRRKTVEVAEPSDGALAAGGETSLAVDAESKPKRAPRKKAVVDDVVQTSAPQFDQAPLVRERAGDGFLQLGPEIDAPVIQPEAVEVVQGERETAASFDGQGDRGRRDRGPRGQRGDRPRRPEASGQPVQGQQIGGESTEQEGEQSPSRRVTLAAEQANEVFAELVSGDFDATREESSEDGGEGAEEGSQKRVLRPEPDAPKLQKVLAQSGVGSRRDIEQMIESGSITVNGEVAHIGQRVSYGDQVKVAGKPIRIRIAPQPARILAYHKPVGEVVTHDDPQGRPTVFRRLPRLQNGKWMSVGRLDLNTEGLLLFTTSGELANQLMHPRFGVEREYAVRVLGTLPDSAKAKLIEGVNIEGQMASFKSIENGGGEGVNHWYRVVITEGRNREVRKLFETVGLAVSRLIRVRYGAIVLPRGLKRGVWVELGESDVRAVKSLAGFDRPENLQTGGRDGRSQGQGQRSQGQGQQNQGGFKGKQNGPNQRGQGQGQGQGASGGRNQNRRGPGADRGDRPQGAYQQETQNSAPQGDHDDDFDHIGPIPNPLEQTFDKRFAKGSKRISQGFGRPDHNAGRSSEPKGGPRQPDPMQTSVGYIGADAYFTKVGGRSGRGGGGGGQQGGGGGGQRGGGRGRR